MANFNASITLFVKFDEKEEEEIKMKNKANSIQLRGTYNPEDDKEYLEYLEREKKEAHYSIYDDYLNNSDDNEN